MTTPSTTYEATIDQANLDYVYRSLTGLYQDKIRAVVREYIANMIDAHKEAGQTRPVKFSITSDGFHFRDYGLGLDVAGIQRAFGNYHDSTKRDGELSELLIGKHGIGAKSGLAISSYFNITSIRDGKRSTAVYTMPDVGVPYLTFSETDVPTDEESGTMVSIPVDERTLSSYSTLISVQNGLNWLNPALIDFSTEYDSFHEIEVGKALAKAIRVAPHMVMNAGVGRYYQSEHPHVILNGFSYELTGMQQDLLREKWNQNFPLIPFASQFISFITDGGELTTHESREKLADAESNSEVLLNFLDESMNIFRDYLVTSLAKTNVSNEFAYQLTQSARNLLGVAEPSFHVHYRSRGYNREYDSVSNVKDLIAREENCLFILGSNAALEREAVQLLRRPVFGLRGNGVVPLELLSKNLDVMSAEEVRAKLQTISASQPGVNTARTTAPEPTYRVYVHDEEQGTHIAQSLTVAQITELAENTEIPMTILREEQNTQSIRRYMEGPVLIRPSGYQRVAFRHMLESLNLRPFNWREVEERRWREAFDALSDETKRVLGLYLRFGYNVRSTINSTHETMIKSKFFATLKEEFHSIENIVQVMNNHNLLSQIERAREIPGVPDFVYEYCTVAYHSFKESDEMMHMFEVASEHGYEVTN